MERDKFGRFIKGHRPYKTFKKNPKYHRHDGLTWHHINIKHNGLHRTEEYKRKIAKTVFKLWGNKDYIIKHAGPNNPNWKGGAMNTYKTLSWRMRAKLRVWANKVKRRDKKCIICHSKKQLQADHIKSVALHPKLVLDIKNGRTLCFNCHVKTETYGKKLFKKLR